MKKYSLDIAIFAAGLPFDGDTIPSGKSLGGSETAAIQMAEAMADLGHKINVFCNTDKESVARGVRYIPIGFVQAPGQQNAFPKGFYDFTRSMPIDALIVQRLPSMLQFETRARVHLLWQHDLATKTGPSQFNPFAWNIDKILVLSQFMKKQYQEIHGGQDSLYHVTRNGVDLDLIDSAVPLNSPDRFSMIYTARPERGLDILLRGVMPRILQREPRAKLYVSRYTDPNTMQFYQQLEAEMKRFGDRVQFLGNLGKQELYRRYKESRLYIYPSMFEEISPLRGDAVIDMPDERATIEELWRRDKKDFWVWSYNQADKQMVLAKARRVVKTRINTPMVTLRMKPTTGCKARCETTLTLTPDHEVMLRDGSYKRADHLKQGDRLMPFGRTPGFGRFKHRGGESKYWYVSRRNLSDRVAEHRYVAEMMLGRQLKRNEIVDHIDGNTSNNAPENLQVWSSHSEHQKDHWHRLDKEERDKRIAENKARIHSYHASLSEKEMHAVKSRAASIGWANRRQAEENHVVVSVELATNADAYCMEVDDTHNFVANGIVVHNCITAMETAACGLPFLGPWRAALPETIGGAAVLINDEGFLAQPGDQTETGLKPPKESFINAMADNAIRLMHDDEWHAKWQRAALAKAQGFSWKPVAEEWVELCHRILAEKTNDGRRMVHHFLVNSDVVAAREYADRSKDKTLVDSVENYVDRWIPFMSRRIADKPSIAEFYEARSGGDHADWRVGFYADKEQRYVQLREFLRPKVESGEIKTLLDFGCAHGGYSRALSNEFPTLKIVGVDNSQSLIRCALEMKASGECKYPENLEFLVGDENSDIMDILANAADSDISMNEMGMYDANKKFDCVVAMEVLEHLPHAEEAAAKLENLCKESGWVVFTMPSGHRERDELLTKGVPPCHVRSFDLHDLREIWGDKPEFSMACFSDLTEAAFDRTFSNWFMVTFKANHRTLGEIDYDRKFLIQAPRQTLAVCVITHNSEDVMRRSLKSVAKLADQMIVVDNGPSIDRTVETAMEFTHDVRAGTSPFWCYKHATVHAPEAIDPQQCNMAGFETPRNESVDGVWADWILWIDSDEQLLDTPNLMKYLRPNMYTGYAVQQHHIAIDAAAANKRDIPVRLYRNIPGMKFYGLVHEHAELGINKGIGSSVMMLSDVHIHHDGYLLESIRRARFARNLKLLECDRKRYPDRLLGWFLYEIRDCQHMARYEMERNGGMVDEKVAAYCQRTIDAYREKFLYGDAVLMNDDAINYYSNAMAVLNEGLDFGAEIEIGKGSTRLPPQHVSVKFKAKDSDEAMLILKKKIEGVAKMYEGRYLQ